MDKVLLFIFDGITDYEITFITHLLKADACKEIVVISYEDRLVTGSSGFVYKPSKLVKDVLDEDVNGLIIGGGWFGEVRDELLALIRKLDSQGKLLAGICGAGTYFLAVSGVLENAKYTTPITNWSEEHIHAFGKTDPFPRENYVQKRVVVNKNIITAQGTAFIDFAIEICDWYNLFNSQDEKDEFTKLYKA